MRPLLLALLLVNGLWWQTLKHHSVDWEPCKTAIGPLQKQAEQFNNAHKAGPQIELMCTYSGDPDRKKQAERHVPLTAEEIKNLHEVQGIEHAAFKVAEAYEDYLLRVHHVREPKPGEPCFYFAGLVLGTDYITIDPNPMDPECR